MGGALGAVVAALLLQCLGLAHATRAADQCYFDGLLARYIYIYV